MPENETLMPDNRSASRWKPISDRIDNSHSPVDELPNIQSQFYAQLRGIWKKWKSRGVDPARLFEAVLTDQRAFHDLLRQTNNDPDARLLREVAVSLESADMETLICDFLAAAWESVEAQLHLGRHGESSSPEFQGEVQHMLDGLHRHLIVDQSRIPPCRSKVPSPDLDARLGESLI